MTGARALFVAYASHLRGVGGVQTCTQEYIAALQAAGLLLDIVPVEPDRRLSTRLLRRIQGSAYFRALSAADRRTIRMRAQGASFVFLNQMNLAGAVGPDDLAGVPAVGLSHGCEITDLLHLARLRRTLPLTTRQLRPSAALALARTLGDESAARAHLAGVLAIAPFDADCERWLGTRHVDWIPRIVASKPLLRQPVRGRFGYVGTLDHAPNLEGLVAVLQAMEQAGSDGLVVRIVGGPQRIGRWLADRHAAAQYLGPLDDQALCEEAATWGGFLHPIFCLPRGCSTKLAGAIAWGLPVVTTPEGRRGYDWRDGAVTEVNTPAAFVGAMKALNEPAVNAAAAAAVVRAAKASPIAGEVAARIAAFLAAIPALTVS